MVKITASMPVEEYNKLLAQSKKFQISHTELQTLCTKICNEMPIAWGWANLGVAEDPKPWRCILTEGYEWYCDQCPVTKICPHDNKQWSK